MVILISHLQQFLRRTVFDQHAKSDNCLLEIVHLGIGQFWLRSDNTKDYNIGIRCFSAKHAALRSKSKARLAQNQDNATYMSTHVLLCQWFSIIKIQVDLGLLIWNKADLIIVSSNCNLFSPWYSWKLLKWR